MFKLEKSILNLIDLTDSDTIRINETTEEQFGNNFGRWWMLILFLPPQKIRMIQSLQWVWLCKAIFVVFAIYSVLYRTSKALLEARHLFWMHCTSKDSLLWFNGFLSLSQCIPFENGFFLCIFRFVVSTMTDRLLCIFYCVS